MKRIFSLFLALFVFSQVSLLLAQEVSLSLEEALALALRNNRQVLLKAEEINQAKEKINEIKAEFFPALNFSAGRTYTRGLYAKDLGQTSTQATLKQYLYRGGKTVNTLFENQYKLTSAEEAFRQEKSEIALDVKKAFYALCLAGEYSLLNKGILDNSKAHLDYFKARYKTGEASSSDILSIEESLSRVQEAYSLSLSQVDSAQGLLKNLLYLDESVKINPKFLFSYAPIDLAYEESFLKALKNNPQIKQYAALAQAGEKAIQAAKADTRPSIYASWDYYSRSTTSLTFSPGKGWQDYNVLGLTFSWPIFDGWAAKSKVEQAIIDLKETQLNKDKITKDVALELKNSYLDFKDALAKLKVSDAESARYQDNFNVVSARYKKGLSSSLDLDDVSLSLKVAQFNKAQVLYDYLLSAAKFYKAMGE